MNSQIMPLRFRIEDIHDLPKCKSNNSRDLSLHVSEFSSEKLSGVRITVEHRIFGSLFTYIINAKGSIITELPDYDELDISMKQVLAQLKRFGFLVEYQPKLHLSLDQINYLKTLQELKYDKLRILKTWTYKGVQKVEDLKIVAFQVDPLGDWLNNAYSPSRVDYLKALDDGTAINLTDISRTQNFRWDWLKGKVLSIEDVLKYAEEPNENPDDSSSDDDIDNNSSDSVFDSGDDTLDTYDNTDADSDDWDSFEDSYNEE